MIHKRSDRDGRRLARCRIRAAIYPYQAKRRTNLDLATGDTLLTITRSVRHRLDFERPVEREVIHQCLEITIQAPAGGNSQGWHFLVVTDPARKAQIGELYRDSFRTLGQMKVALRHKKCSHQFLGFAHPSCSVFPLEIREPMSLTILRGQRVALLVSENHESGHIWEEKDARRRLDVLISWE